MVLRQPAIGILKAERSFHRAKGWKQIPQLVEALGRRANLNSAGDTETVSAAV
jgi:hypothetical protein